MKQSLSLSMLAAAALLSAPLAAQQNPPVSGKGHVPLNPFTGTQSVSDLVAPDSATLIAGTLTSPTGWLNLSNTSITLEEAMTDPTILTMGYANFQDGYIVEVTFASGVTNGPGDDLSMVDAQYDFGEYLISTDFDGFAAQLPVNTTGGTLIGSGDYYFEPNVGSTFFANIVERRFDLTDLGVPAGATVNSIRFEAEGSAADPMALAKINRDFSLSLGTLVGGQTGTVSLSNCTPNGLISMSYSLRGSNQTVINGGPCGSITVDLSAPVRLLVNDFADASGNYSFSATVSSAIVGRTIWIQGLDVGTCAISNVASTVVL